MNDLNDMVQRLDRIRRETEDLERDIAKIRSELDNKPDMTPGPEDIGRWVEVRDRESDDWKGPKLLRSVYDDDMPFLTDGVTWWRQARIVPGVGRVTMQEHDGSPNKPEWLADDDDVLVEFRWHNVVLLPALHIPWGDALRYQRLEIK